MYDLFQERNDGLQATMNTISYDIKSEQHYSLTQGSLFGAFQIF